MGQLADRLMAVPQMESRFNVQATATCGRMLRYESTRRRTKAGHEHGRSRPGDRAAQSRRPSRADWAGRPRRPGGAAVSVRSEARRHRGELGAVVAGYRDRPPVLVIGAFVALWLLFSGLTLINPGETILLAMAPTVIFAILFWVTLLYVGNERLLVCERGLVIGSFAPGLRPYVVRYDQIVPGSVVPVTGARQYAGETGSGSLGQSTVRRNAWTRQGVHLVGPSPKVARRHRARFATVLDPPPRSVDGRWVWFVGTGSTPPEQVTARIAQAAGVSGAAELARATASAPVRELSGKPADASRHLPGLPSIPDLRGREAGR